MKFLLIIFALVVVFGFLWSRSNDNQQSLMIAIRYRAPYIEGLSEKPSDDEILSYLKAHPQCCRVEGEDFFLASSFWDTLFGVHTTWVRIAHLRRDRHEKPTEGGNSDVYLGINRHGEVFRRTGEHYYRGPAFIQ